MVKIEINGKCVEAHEGDMLIDVADDAKISIPRFCYHKKLSIAANCRMCLVEVEGAPKALPACATPVTDGMKVFTKSNKAVAAQKSVMEFLLINHPLDCPICDQGGECELQDVAMTYGDDVSKYSEEKRIVGDKNIGPLISTDMTRCIHCTRCVRFGQEVGGMMELGATGRSEWMSIGTYIEKSVTSEMSGNMIDLCPVGALTSKPFRYSARPWELKSARTIAAHDSVGSNLIVHSKNNEVKRVVPDENETVNEVWISDRDRFGYEGVNSEERLLSPKIKVNGQWQTVDWQTALDFTAEKMKTISEISASEIGVIASENSTLEELYLLKKLANGLGIENLDTRTYQTDFSAEGVADIAKRLPVAFEMLEKQSAILLTGSYLRKEIPLLNHRLRKAHLAGAQVSAINPSAFEMNFDLANEISEFDYLSQLKGVAVALGASIANVEVSESHNAIAESLKSNQNSIVMVGQIAQQSSDYAQIVAVSQLIAEHSDSKLAILPLFANTVGAGEVGFEPGQSGKSISAMLASAMKMYINLGVEIDQDVLLDGAVSAMKAAECVVQLTPFETSAMLDYADVLLPVSSSFETSGTFVNAAGDKQSFTMAVEPKGDSKPAWKILRVLGNLVGQEGFDYCHANEVLGDIECKAKATEVSKLSINDNGLSAKAIKLTSMYQLDAVVRRSTSLQTTPDAQSIMLTK